MENSKKNTNYIWVVLAVLLVIGMLAWAYMSGRNDGAEHRRNRANQNARQ